MADNIPLPSLPRREADSHKGDFGRALVIGGSVGMSGAAALAGMAALRSGAGRVRVAVPDACLLAVASSNPCYMTLALPTDSGGVIARAASALLHREAEVATAVACGPGLGRSKDLSDLVVDLYQSVARPMVVDADGLNALAERINDLGQPKAPRVLTPHPGEFARLGGKTDTSRRAAVAVEFARRHGVILVLKGHHTIITDGTRTRTNETGNPGMATGGTGDVLTGVITALICQGLAPFEAAALGAHVHGLAGDLAAADLGQIGLIASDLIDYLPRAFQALDGQKPASA